MKMKSFAMFALSGLLAASFAYVAPAMADDSNDQSMPMFSDNNDQDQTFNLADNSSTQGADSAMQNQDSSTTGSTSDSNATSGNATSGGSTSSSDEATPDAATGEDDY